MGQDRPREDDDDGGGWWRRTAFAVLSRGKRETGPGLNTYSIVIHSTFYV